MTLDQVFLLHSSVTTRKNEINFLSQKRIASNRNGYFPCYVHRIKDPNENAKSSPFFFAFSRIDILKSGFESFGRFLTVKWVKAALISLTLALLAVSIWGVIELKQKFDPLWFLSTDSYLYKWAVIYDDNFPSAAEKLHIFMADINLPDDLYKVDHVVSGLEERRESRFPSR